VTLLQYYSNQKIWNKEIRFYLRPLFGLVWFGLVWFANDNITNHIKKSTTTTTTTTQRI
jgi:hypothetical protein